MKKFEKRKVYPSFKYNIWGPDLADMQQISEYNKRIECSLCAINIFNKCKQSAPLKDKQELQQLNLSKNIS